MEDCCGICAITRRLEEVEWYLNCGWKEIYIYIYPYFLRQCIIWSIFSLPTRFRVSIQYINLSKLTKLSLISISNRFRMWFHSYQRFGNNVYSDLQKKDSGFRILLKLWTIFSSSKSPHKLLNNVISWKCYVFHFFLFFILPDLIILESHKYNFWCTDLANF